MTDDEFYRALGAAVERDSYGVNYHIPTVAAALHQYGDDRAREATEAERRRCATIDHIDLDLIRREARAAGIEEAARWHDREAERIGKLAAEPRNACNQTKMHEAADEHENHAIFIRALAEKPGSQT